MEETWAAGYLAGRTRLSDSATRRCGIGAETTSGLADQILPPRRFTAPKKNTSTMFTVYDFSASQHRKSAEAAALWRNSNFMTS